MVWTVEFFIITFKADDRRDTTTLWLDYTVNQNTLGNSHPLTGTWSACRNSFTNPIHIALLFCKRTEHARENWLSSITDHLPMSISYIFTSLDGHSFIKIFFMDYSVFSTMERNNLNEHYGLQSARYISYCVHLAYSFFCDQLLCSLCFEAIHNFTHWLGCMIISMKSRASLVGSLVE